MRQAAEPLLVDLSPAPPPADAEVRAWAATQTVFVSSVMRGMEAERRAAAAAIAAIGAVPVLFEDFGGMDDDPEAAYLGNVAAADIYLGILGPRYGKPSKSGYSATHAEYDEAGRQGLRVTVWSAEDDLDGRQRDFLESVRVFHATGSYASPEDLAVRVERRLRAMAAESLTPWVKVGNAVFRASGIVDDGKTVTVRARIRDNTVVASLEGRRSSPHGSRGTATRITWPGGTAAVWIAGIEVEVGASNARTVTVTGNRTGDAQSSALDMSFDGRSSDDLTELAMRISLFGEPNPLGHMSFMVQVENPLPALEGSRLSEDAIGQVAELLLTEVLVAERGVNHLTAFQLGPKHKGTRPLLLGWMPRRRSSSQAPVERRIEGHVTVES